METGGVFHDSAISNVLLKNECSSEVLDSLWLPNSSSPFHGSAASLVNFEDNTAAERQLFYGQQQHQIDPKLESCFSEEYEGCFQPAEKKRRLSVEQVQFLEKSFEVENKLEPERKVQLAKDLGLQPRQVAIWFQNRRARYKTKLLEKEYDALKSSYDKLKADYDALLKQNEKTKNEVNLLTERLLSRGKAKKSKMEVSDDPVVCPLRSQPAAAAVERASSAKSDVVDSDCSRHSSLEAAADSGDILESDSSQEEEEKLSMTRRGFLPPLGFFPKMEAEYYGDDDDLQPNSCNLGFPVQNQGTWLWHFD